MTLLPAWVHGLISTPSLLTLMNLSARKEPEVKLEHTSMATQIKTQHDVHTLGRTNDERADRWNDSESALRSFEVSFQVASAVLRATLHGAVSPDRATSRSDASKRSAASPRIPITFWSRWTKSTSCQPKPRLSIYYIKDRTTCGTHSLSFTSNLVWLVKGTSILQSKTTRNELNFCVHSSMKPVGS